MVLFLPIRYYEMVRIIIATKMEKTQDAKKRCAGASRSIASVSLKGGQQQ
jgi:hypothetical protein